MASCFIKNPSPKVLLACSIFGAGLSLVGVPVAVYTLAPRVSESVIDLKENNPNVKQLTHSIDQKLDQSRSTLCQKLDKILPTDKRMMNAIVDTTCGSMFMFSSTMSLIGHTMSNIEKYKSNPLIQTVCCNRIRFFAIVALVEGLWAGCFIAGSYITVNGSMIIYRLRKERSSLIHNGMN